MQLHVLIVSTAGAVVVVGTAIVVVVVVVQLPVIIIACRMIHSTGTIRAVLQNVRACVIVRGLGGIVIR